MFFKMHCKPFSCEPRSENRIWIDTKNCVRVYDNVARHYTTVHSLSKSELAQARKFARQR